MKVSNNQRKLILSMDQRIRIENAVAIRNHQNLALNSWKLKSNQLKGKTSYNHLLLPSHSLVSFKLSLLYFEIQVIVK